MLGLKNKKIKKKKIKNRGKNFLAVTMEWVNVPGPEISYFIESCK